jgi:zinc protease
LAVDVSAYQHSREISSFFLLASTAAPGQSLAEITALIDERIQQVADEGPNDDEMERGLAQAEAHFMYRLQTIGGFGGKSDQLNAYNVFRGDPGFFSGDLERYRSSTRESVRATSHRYLAFDRRVVLSVVPRGHTALALPGSEPVAVS